MLCNLLFQINSYNMERNLKRKKGPHVQMYQEGPKPLPKNQLPLWRDVGLALGYATVMENKSKCEAVKDVSSEVIEIYQRASIETIDPRKIT